MASKYVKDLRELEQECRKDGWDRRANIARGAANRMERMEETIVEMNLRLRTAP